MQKELSVVQCQASKGAGSGFVTEREAAKTCHYPQRGGGDEVALKYRGLVVHQQLDR